MLTLKRLIISITAIVTLLIITVNSSFASETRIYIATDKNGILVSENNGRSWSSFNKGLPEGFAPLRFYGDKTDIYLTTYNSGIFRLESNRWIELNDKDFRRRSIYSSNPGYRKISAFAIDPSDSSNLALATKHTIYRSRNRGESWQKLSVNGLSRRSYITALAVSGNSIYAGTSFNGILEYSGRGFKSSGNGLPAEPYSATMKFTEQVSSLYISKNRLYAGFQFGGGLYSKALKSGNFEPVIKSNDNRFDSIIYDIKGSDEKIYFSDGKKIIYKNSHSITELSEFDAILEKISTLKGIKSAIIENRGNSFPMLALWISNPEAEHSERAAEGKKAIYLSVPAIQKNLSKYLEFANSTEIDTFVIDMKDDFGNIYFPSDNRTAVEIRALRKPLNLKSLLPKLKSHGIYTVARIVTFKDEKLFKGFNGKYSIKNKKNGAPWRGAEGEFWVDPYSEFVHDYNIELAKELEKAGFDEIQFDYIRFPSDGPVHLCKFSFQKDLETYKSEILIDFLKKAKQSLRIPVSVDIYGFNSWYYFGNMIGQDMEDLSYTVDVICPMVYPSHYGSSFYKKFDYKIRPYRIVRDGGIRGGQMLNRRTILRPYIQGFNLMSPTWGPGYITDQIKAAEESGCSGYTIWNAKGDYDIPHKALKGKK